MWHEAEKVLFDDLPKQEILAAYLSGRGKEVESGKFANPESSSALVANTFGAFLTRPDLLQLTFAVQPRKVSLEREVRFPWRGGLHPWLDVVIETDEQFIGTESKRFEPFREKKTFFSEAFQRDVWGPSMDPYKRLRDELSKSFLHLDPVQLTKHAFALRTQATKRDRKPVLVYLYAEPVAFRNGNQILESSIVRHRKEVDQYARAVAGAEVEFTSLTYSELLEYWRSIPHLRGHAQRIGDHYDVSRSRTVTEAAQ